MSEPPMPSRGPSWFLMISMLTLFAAGAAVGYQWIGSAAAESAPDAAVQPAVASATQPVSQGSSTKPKLAGGQPASTGAKTGAKAEPVGGAAAAGNGGDGKAGDAHPAWVEQETQAAKLLQQAEALFADKRWPEAKALYTKFATAFAKTKIFEQNAELVKNRLAAVGDQLDPRPRPGAIGWYFQGQTFEAGDLLMERIDPTIDFGWGDGAPAPAVPDDHFCVRWVGWLRVAKAGHYTIATVTDDGVRLELDGKKIIDQWVDQGDTRVATELDLKAGDHPFQMDYYEDAGGATARLFWALKDQFAERPVPAEAFWHDPRMVKHLLLHPAERSPTLPTNPDPDDDQF
ncbi:MAG: PA14 domain-containing protein [Planctomycetota bacterium]